MTHNLNGKDIYLKYEDREAEIFNKGYDAYLDGAEQNDNPYKKTTIDYGLWEDGWLVAMNDEYSEQTS